METLLKKTLRSLPADVAPGSEVVGAAVGAAGAAVGTADKVTSLLGAHVAHEEGLNAREAAKERKRQKQLRVEEIRRNQMGTSSRAAMDLDRLYSEDDGALFKVVLAIHKLLSSTKFDAVMGVVIFVNSIAIGVQVEFELAGKDTSYLMLLDNIFLFIYAIELGLRFVAYGFVCLTSGRLSLF